MRRFDICELLNKGAFKHAIVLQADFHAGLATRVIAPLSTGDTSVAVEILNPILNVKGAEMVLWTEMMLSVPSDRLGRIIANAGEQDYEFTRAMDFLLNGV